MTRSLQRNGANIMGTLGGGSCGSRPPSSVGSGGNISIHSREPLDLGPPAPPSGRTGIMYASNAPTLTPNYGPYENVPALKNVTMRRPGVNPEAQPSAVWSDSVQHLGDDDWPVNAVPLFVFTGQRDRPRPGYREEVKFRVREDKYMSFAIRLRAGGGDRYMGGSIGLMYTDDRRETMPGEEGQLATVLDIVIQLDNSIELTVVGDLPFRVMRAWLPRGWRGLQMAIVDVMKVAPRLTHILGTCEVEPDMELFAQVLKGLPALAQMLTGPGPFTAFVPMNRSFDLSAEELFANPRLESVVQCHISTTHVPLEAMYSGRPLHAVDGTLLMVSFSQWPRGGPMVNGIPIEHMDIQCSNGVIHLIDGVLTPDPARGRPK